MLTLKAVGKGTAPHQKPVVEDPVTNDEFSCSQLSKKYQHPQNQEMNASRQKYFVILSLSMCTALNK